MNRFLPRFLLLLLLPVWAVANTVKPAAKPILVLGDSLSAAYQMPVESGWVALLTKRLSAQNVKHPRPIINASISGETTAGGLARLPTLLEKHQPVLVIIELGANDGLRGLPLDEIRRNLTSLIELSRAEKAQVMLIGIELPVNYGTSYREAFRVIYKEVATKYKLPFVPFLLEEVALDSTLIQEDGLHPTAEAQPKILENVWSVLEPVLNKLPK